MAVPRTGARPEGVTVASLGRAVPGVTHARPPAVCRRCKGGSGQLGDVEMPAHRTRAAGHLARQVALLRVGSRAGRRAARSARL
jgi:hypothetical protein